jgi:2',3'-cyclic-nucleotide 2'-phosphodiesterase (5'-nucleotidase family)
LSVSFIHTNDLHGKLTPERAERLAARRSEVDLYFDSGDAILAGNLGVPLRPEAVWPLLLDLRCTASVPGNRESHPLAAAFRAKLAGVRHPLLCANLRLKDGTHPLPGSLEFETNGVRVGVAAAMVEMVTARMKTQAASAYLWEPALPTLRELGEDLRPRVDLLIALTHIGHRRDLELAVDGPYDVILGGHSHTVLSEPERVGKTWVCQGGSHGRFVGTYRWDAGVLTGGLEPL